MVHIFVFFYTKNISKMQEKLIQMSATPPPLTQGWKPVSVQKGSLGSQVTRGQETPHLPRRCLPCQPPQKHQKQPSCLYSHLHTATYRNPFRDRHYALGGTSDLTSVRNIVCITSERSDWKDGELLYLNVKKEEKLVPKDSFTYTVK